MGILSGSFSINAVYDGVDGTNGISYAIITNTESWHLRAGSSIEPSSLTWSYVINDGTETKTISTLSGALALGLTPKYQRDGGEITDVAGTFSLSIYSDTTSLTVFLYNGDNVVAQKTIRGTSGISSVTQQYYLSTSCSVLQGGSWSSIVPTRIAGTYIWMRSMTTYTDGYTSYSEGVCLTSDKMRNKLTNGDTSYSNASYLVATYRPIVPLVAGYKYRLTICITPAADLDYISPYLSSGSGWLDSIDTDGTTNKQIISKVFTAKYYGNLTPDVSPSYGYLNLYRFPNPSSVSSPGTTTIHWARVDVGIMSEVVKYALSTSNTEPPTSGWSTTAPTATVGTYVWQQVYQEYEDGTSAALGATCITGAAGAKLRMRNWSSDVSYLAGMGGESFYDVVVYNNLMYRCIKSHSSSSSILPSNTTYWQVATDWQFIATELMLARKIVSSEIDVESMVVSQLHTSGDGPTIAIQQGMMEVFGSVNKLLPNIRFGVNDDGYAVMQYFDNSGNFLYDLGPSGISSIEAREEKWITYHRKYLGTSESSVIGGQAYIDVLYDKGADIYQYVSKMVAGVVEDTANDGRFFNTKTVNVNYRITGWYCVTAMSGATSEMPMQYIGDTEPSDMSTYNPSINMGTGYAVYFKTLEYYSAGKLTRRQNVYWSVAL